MGAIPFLPTFGNILLSFLTRTFILLVGQMGTLETLFCNWNQKLDLKTIY